MNTIDISYNHKNISLAPKKLWRITCYFLKMHIKIHLKKRIFSSKQWRIYILAIIIIFFFGTIFASESFTQKHKTRDPY